jgi:hypothetical protein
MNYLVTHYKNLAEQLQARINHIQQCLYEMDKATAAPPGGLNDPFANEPSPKVTETPNPTQDTQVPNGGPTPGGVAPWRIMPPPVPGTTYTWGGKLYQCVPGGWMVQTSEGWRGVWWGGQDVPRPDPKPTPSTPGPVRPWSPPAGTAPATTTPRIRPQR